MLFTGIVTFVVVCSCLKQWSVLLEYTRRELSLEYVFIRRVLPLPGENGFKEKGSAKERSRRLLQELSSTENPLWAEHKLRLYEEQELTMNVFGENAEAYNHQRELPPVAVRRLCMQTFGSRCAIVTCFFFRRTTCTRPFREEEVREITPLSTARGIQE